MNVVRVVAGGVALIACAGCPGGSDRPPVTGPTGLTIQAHAGDAQTALVGRPTNIRPAVRITNAGGPVAGIGVTFTVTGGGGTRTGAATVTTNANGVAQVGGWTVGGGAGLNTMSARATSGAFTGADSVTFTATGLTAQFNIDIRNIGPAFAPAVQAAFNAAEAFWESAIYGDLSNIPVNTINACGTGTTIAETVDDLIILARFDSIDGPGQTLGRAGACSIRSSNGLPVYGLMRFDTADVATMIGNGSLNAVILHEMGHVLGFSDGIWNTQAGVGSPRVCGQNMQYTGNDPNQPVSGLDTHFNCTQTSARNGARAVFDTIGGQSFSGGGRVPLENCVASVPPSCGAGNLYSHWREHAFDNELMTPYLDTGTDALSIVTLASFEDNGYLVNYSAAQAYTRIFTTPPAAAAAARSPLVDLSDDIRHGPLDIVDDRTGRVLRVVQQ